jgi:hypothetical protein
MNSSNSYYGKLVTLPPPPAAAALYEVKPKFKAQKLTFSLDEYKRKVRHHISLFRFHSLKLKHHSIS